MTDGASRLLARLRARWPQVFCWPPRPLAIGIASPLHRALYPAEHEGLWELSRHGRALSAALEVWTSQPAYLAALAEGAPRFDLDGNPAGAVTERQAEYALASLARLQDVQPLV